LAHGSCVRRLSRGFRSLYHLNRPLAPHAHREGHLIFLVEGMPAAVRVDGDVRPVDGGHAVAVSPWQAHDFRPTDLGRGAIFLTLYIAPSFLGRVAGDGRAIRFGAASIALSAPILSPMRRVVEGIMSRHSAGRVGALVHDLVAASWEASRSQPAPCPAGGGVLRIADFRIRNAVRLMNERVTDAVALDRVARDAGLSRPHFYKLFRENVGVTPNMYLNTLRLERSIARLTQTADAVTSIGLDLGFASQASFTRFFVNNIGIAPTDYRRVSCLAA
jgi:AraC-like DNA-binding protein